MSIVQRNALFPILHEPLWKLYKKGVNQFWTVEEVSLASDTRDWKKLTENEKHFLSYIIGFFAGSDLIVTENLAQRFMREVEETEGQAFYSNQIFMEFIHSEMYSILLETFITDPKEKEKLLNAIATIPSIEKKAKWAKKWIEDSSSFGERMIAFACVEGIFFSGAFCSIFWIKKRGLMPGLCQSNELIMKDEALHCEFACTYFENYIKDKPSEERIKQIFSEAVELEIEFITESLPVDLIGMSSVLMSQYIQYVADFWLTALNLTPLYNVDNPFDWMVLQSLERKHNFFEKKVTVYERGANTSSSLEELDDF